MSTSVERTEPDRDGEHRGVEAVGGVRAEEAI
jgi:hypothetical protein